MTAQFLPHLKAQGSPDLFLSESERFFLRLILTKGIECALW
jgi:hypothetical protein